MSRWYSPKGILGKIDHAVRTSALVEGVEELGKGAWGLTNDIITAPFELPGEIQEQGFGKALNAEFKSRLGHVGTTLHGAETATIGQLAGRGSVEKINEGLTWSYTNLVDEPIATGFTAQSLAIEEGPASLGKLFRPGTWKQSYNVVNTEHRTIGQSFILAQRIAAGELTGLEDITVQGEDTSRFLANDWVQMTTGTIDVVAPFFIAPELAVLKGAGAARTKLITKPVKADADFATLVQQPRSQKTLAHIARLRAEDPTTAAARIRNLVWPNHERGAELSAVFASSDSIAKDQLLLRYAYGDLRAANDLENIDLALGRQLQRTMGDRQVLRESGAVDAPYDMNGQMYLPLNESSVAKIDAELAQLYDLETRALHRQELLGVLENEIRVPRSALARDKITRSKFYNDGGGMGMRAVFQGRPHHLLYLDDVSSEVQFHRQTQHSRLTQPERDQARSDYLNAVSSTERAAVHERWQDTSVDRIFQHYGYTKTDRDALIANMKLGVASALNSLGKREAFGSHSVVKLDDGGRTEIPLMVAQNEQVHILIDLKEVERLAARNRPAARALVDPATKEAFYNVGKDTLTQFNHAWKATTLLRAAYPIKVGIDSQLRIAAQLGVMANLSYAKSGIINTVKDANTIQNRLASNRAAAETKLGRTLTLEELAELRKNIRAEYRNSELIRGFRDLEINGRQVAPILGGKGSLINDQISSQGAHREYFGLEEHRMKSVVESALAQYSPTGDWRNTLRYDPKDPDAVTTWNSAYLRDTNRQIGSDVAAGKILRGESDEQILQWVRSPEGGRYRRGLHRHYQTHPDQWLANLRGQIDDYLPTQALRDAALRKEVTVSLADAEFAKNKISRPDVHGERLAQHMPGHAHIAMINATVDKLANGLMSLPDTILSRNLLANHTYANELQRLMDLHDVQSRKMGQVGADGKIPLSAEREQQMYKQAKMKAVRAVKRTLYDLSEASDLSHTLRFVSPFFNAWQEALTVWGRTIWEKPQTLVQLNNLWEAPDRAGLLYTDKDGNEYLTLPVPDFLADKIPGLKFVDDIKLSKKGFGIAAQGLPGVGAIGGIPVAKIAKDRPELAQSRIVELAFPFGAPTTFAEAVFPTTIKNLIAANSAEDTDAFKRNWRMVYVKELSEWQRGLRQTKPDMAEIEEAANAMTDLRSLMQYVAPSGVSFNTPLQPYFDIYAGLMKQDPSTADEKFYDQYPEYFSVTQSMSRSINGVPATVEGLKASEKYADLLTEFPEYGRMIIGEEGVGPFSHSVYKYQTTHALGPGRSTKQREKLSRDEFVVEVDQKTGWAEFGRNMQTLYGALEERGLTNFTEHGAEDLREIKKAMVAQLSTKYEHWGKEYGMQDTTKWTRKISALREISAHPSLTGRDEIEGLREYLDLRDIITGALKERRYSTLAADANADLATLWEAARSDLVRRNTSFSSLYFRYLDSDTLEAS